MSATSTPCATRSESPLPSQFSLLLPKFQSIARFYFRHVSCQQQQDECLAESVAIGWSWFCRLLERGRDPADFPVTFALMACRAVACGRRLCGQEPITEPFAKRCQRRHGHGVVSWPDASVTRGPPFEEALADNRQSPVPVQVQFRIDFAEWVQTLPALKLNVLKCLALGHGTQMVAKTFGRSPARISQIRHELRQGYLAFLREPCSD